MTAWLEWQAMAIDVVATATIDRPVGEVEAYLRDPANDLVWIRALTSSEVLTGYPIGEGTRVRRVARMMGRAMPYTTEIVASEPGKVVMETVEGPFPMVVTYEFREGPGGGTVVRVRNQGGRGVMFAIFGWLIGRMVNARVKGDLAQLKRVLEGGEAGS